MSDTHVPDHRLDRVPGMLFDLAERADVILHAGDVTEGGLLDELERRGEVHAVLGNNDTSLVGRLSETVEVEVAGVRLAMIHDAGPRKGRPTRMGRSFPDADVVVFGHSHLPECGPGAGEQLLVNPGSPTQRRRAPHPTVAVLEIKGGAVVVARHRRVPDGEIVPVPAPVR